MRAPAQLKLANACREWVLSGVSHTRGANLGRFVLVWSSQKTGVRAREMQTYVGLFLFFLSGWIWSSLKVSNDRCFLRGISLTQDGFLTRLTKQFGPPTPKVTKSIFCAFFEERTYSFQGFGGSCHFVFLGELLKQAKSW